MARSSLSLLFTGHMVDARDREAPRFPPTLVELAQKEIARRVARHGGEGKADVKGFASLARGGDVLFHEVCRSQGIDTVIVLPFSAEAFLKTSVEGAEGGNWPERFRRIWNETPSDAKYNLGLPQSDEAYAKCNERLLACERVWCRAAHRALGRQRRRGSRRHLGFRRTRAAHIRPGARNHRSEESVR